MNFNVLGALDVVDAGRPVEIRGRKQRELLAVLLVHANEVVSADRLIDALWGEAPPPTALKTLQAHISRLRTTLNGTDSADSGRLETRGHGYVLRVESGELDAQRFRAMLDDGRRALAAGEAERADETLTHALSFWRGPALADFAYAEFAQEEIARLEELRLAAREERIEALLALGRHAEVIPELDALVNQHPLRERLRGQLMLALYRSGRQAEALQVYQEGRRALAEELGLEPSQSLQQLERRILEHDPALELPVGHADETASEVSAGASRRRVSIVAGVAAATVVLAAAVLGLTLPADDANPAGAGAVALDPSSGETIAEVALGTAPSSVAVGEGSAWVLDADDRTISQIDSETLDVVRTFGTGENPSDIAVGSGAVWVANGSRAHDSGFPESVSRIDVLSGVDVETIELRPPPGGHLFGVLPGVSRQYIATTHDAVWVVNADLSVSRIDPRTNRVVAVVDDVEAENIAAGEGRVWITEKNHLVEIDQSRNAVSRRIAVGDADLADDSLAGLAIGAGAVWVAEPFAGRIWRVTPGRRDRQQAIEVDMWVAALTFGEGAVWATNEIADLVYRIDPRTMRVRTIDAIAPRGVGTGDGAVWVAASSAPSADAALPAAICSRVAYEGPGTPDLLLVSDMPLRDPSVRQWTRSLVDGFRLVLEHRGYEAGAYTVGFQSCDSSTAQSSTSDFFRCGSNAKAYARNLKVVGVFGSFSSPCSYIQIPITNAAPEGTLPMISPSNTFDGLTEDESLYPSGVRSYFRLASHNRFQAPAQIELAKQLGKRRVFLLTSAAQEYGVRYPADLQRYALRVGVDIVERARFDPDSTSHSALVRKVAARRPQAVAIVGILTTGTGELVRQLRTALGPGVPVVVPDGFQVPEDLVALAGPPAQGVYVTAYGLPNAQLPARGKQFLEQFGSTRGGDRGPDFAAAYGGQAAEILLDAIARSDGTRSSVTQELRRTRIEGGILGDIRFDRNGDLVDAPITILRLVGDELVVDRVVVVRTPRPGGP
jgi:DNA-binding SARP family transcriptional activator/ABC-type branched-subunit amino acid transport system substrate-binding protein/DNA-binding beta-propeller fold protein YncE